MKKFNIMKKFKKSIVCLIAFTAFSVGFTANASAFGMPTFDFVQMGNAIAQIIQTIDRIKNAIKTFQELKEQGKQIATTLKNIKDLGKDFDVTDYMEKVKDTINGIQDDIDELTVSLKDYDEDLRQYDDRFNFKGGAEDRKKLVAWNENLKAEIKSGLSLQNQSAKSNEKRAKNIRDIADSIDSAESALQATQLTAKLLANISLQIKDLTQIVLQNAKVRQEHEAMELQRLEYTDKNMMKIGTYVKPKK